MKKSLLAISISILSIGAQSYEVSDIKEISAGKYKTFFTLENGYLYTTNNSKKDATNLSNLELISSDVLSTSVGNNHAFKITNDKKLFSVGKNEFGELGLNNFDDFENWQEITDFKSVNKVVSENGVSFVIDSNNTLFAAGWNPHKLIDDESEKVNSFQKIAENVSDVDGSLMYISYIDKDKNLFIKGHPNFGFKSFKEFTKIAENVDAFSGGQYHLLYLSGDELFGIGANHQGQLGKKVATFAPEKFLSNFSEIPVSLATGVKKISTGTYHSMYIDNEDNLFVAGNNGNGQLGIGSQELSNMWTKTLSNVKTISSGAFHSFAIKNDNTLWIAGNNAQGQLTFKSDKENTYFYGDEMRTNIETWSWRPIYFKSFDESYGDEK